MIKKIAHVALTVGNLEEGIKFYQNLGFSEQKRFEEESPKLKAVFMDKDGMGLELFEFEDISDSKAEIIKNHIGFITDDLEKDIEEFQNNGFQVVIPTRTGVTVKRYAFLKDNTGGVIELIEI